MRLSVIKEMLMKRYFTLVLALLFLTPLPGTSLGDDFSDFMEKDYAYLEKFYKDIHSHPELSEREKETSRKIAEELRKTGFNVTENVGGYGVVGVFENGEGPTIMVRTDMDALPITEKTGVEYASKVTDKYQVGDEIVDVGVFHGCGHDMHMTIFTGTAHYLMRNKDKWKGTLIMIGQPAEENCVGARAMIKDGLFKRFPRPDYIFGLHVMPFPTGLVGSHEGYWFAGDVDLDLIVRGSGGNSHRPQDCKDPVIVSAEIISALQTIVSREIDPLEPAVLTVSVIRGGVSAWTIPEEVYMAVDIRAFKDEIKDKIVKSVKRVSENIARAAGIPEDRMPIIKKTTDVLPLYNDPELTREVIGIFEKTFGDENVIEIPLIMGTEDFASYGLAKPKIPICFFGVGCVNPRIFEKAMKRGKNVPGLHNPAFYPEIEPTVKTGVRAMTSVVLNMFAGKRKEE